MGDRAFPVAPRRVQKHKRQTWAGAIVRMLQRNGRSIARNLAKYDQGRAAERERRPDMLVFLETVYGLGDAQVDSLVEKVVLLAEGEGVGSEDESND